MFQVIKEQGKARRGVFTCAHGRVETPVFMNVGTQGAIKGAVSAEDLKEIGCRWSCPTPIISMCVRGTM